MKPPVAHILAFILCMILVIWQCCTTTENGTKTVPGSSCPAITSCAPAVHPIPELFDLANLVSTGKGKITDLNVRDLDSVYFDMESGPIDNDFYQDSVKYPYRPWEFLTFQAENYPTNAKIDSCPCDPSFALLDFTILTPNEKGQLKDASHTSEKEGSGNAIIPLPRINFPQNSCFSDTAKFNKCIPDTINRIRDTIRTIIAILDTGLDERWVTAFKNDQALAPYVVGGNLLNLEPNFSGPSATPPRNLDDLSDPIGHGSMVTVIADHYAGDYTKFLIYKTHNNQGLGTSFSTMCGLICAVKNGADIINMSFGAYVENSGIDSILGEVRHKTLERESGAKGKWEPPVMVASKGNHGFNTDTIHHLPSDNIHVHGISGLHWTSALLESGQFNDIAAPPVSNKNEHWTCSNYSIDKEIFAAPAFVFLINSAGQEIDRAWGTSFAAPYFSGMAARQNKRDDFVTWRNGLGTDCNEFNTQVLNYPSLE